MLPEQVFQRRVAELAARNAELEMMNANLVFSISGAMRVLGDPAALFSIDSETSGVHEASVSKAIGVLQEGLSSLLGADSSEAG